DLPARLRPAAEDPGDRARRADSFPADRLALRHSERDAYLLRRPRADSESGAVPAAALGADRADRVRVPADDEPGRPVDLYAARRLRGLSRRGNPAVLDRLQPRGRHARPAEPLRRARVDERCRLP